MLNENKFWTEYAVENDEGREVVDPCNFVWMRQGYYRHSGCYTSHFPGMARFEDTIVNPQTRREDLDNKHKEIRVMGSGAKAA